jgi:hypothetical protein
MRYVSVLLLLFLWSACSIPRYRTTSKFGDVYESLAGSKIAVLTAYGASDDLVKELTGKLYRRLKECSSYEVLHEVDIRRNYTLPSIDAAKWDSTMLRQFQQYTDLGYVATLRLSARTQDFGHVAIQQDYGMLNDATVQLQVWDIKNGNLLKEITTYGRAETNARQEPVLLADAESLLRTATNKVIKKLVQHTDCTAPVR